MGIRRLMDRGQDPISWPLSYFLGNAVDQRSDSDYSEQRGTWIRRNDKAWANSYQMKGYSEGTIETRRDTTN